MNHIPPCRRAFAKRRRHAKNFVFALVLFVGLSQQAFTQESGDSEVNPKNLPQGVSAAKARELLRAGDASSEKDLQAVQVRRRELMRQVTEITADARAALKGVLDADKTGKYQSYLADVERILKMKVKERRAALREFEGKYLSFFRDAFKRAKIDEAGLQARLSKVLPGAKFGPFLTARGKEPSAAEEVAAFERANAVQDTQTFNEPFGIRSTKETTQGISAQSAVTSASLDTGRIFGSVTIALGLGNGRATAAVGQAVEISPGVRQIRATVASDTGYDLFAFSMVLNGAAGAWADASIEIDKPDGARRRKVQNLGWVVAPVLWFASDSGEDEPLSLSRQVSVPGNAGGQFQIKARFTAEAYTYGAAGAGDGFGSSTLKSITVRSIP